MSRPKPLPGRNLTVQLSCDACRTWPVKKVLDPGPAAYSDVARLPEGTLFCLRNRGQVDGFMFWEKNQTSVRFNLEWVTGTKADGQ